MPEYAMEDSYSIGSTGSISAYGQDVRVTPRHEQVKALDEALSRLDLKVSSLADRIGPSAWTCRRWSSHHAPPLTCVPMRLATFLLSPTYRTQSSAS